MAENQTSDRDTFGPVTVQRIALTLRDAGCVADVETDEDGRVTWLKSSVASANFAVFPSFTDRDPAALFAYSFQASWSRDIPRSVGIEITNKYNSRSQGRLAKAYFGDTPSAFVLETDVLTFAGASDMNLRSSLHYWFESMSLFLDFLQAELLAGAIA